MIFYTHFETTGKITYETISVHNSYLGNIADRTGFTEEIYVNL